MGTAASARRCTAALIALLTVVALAVGVRASDARADTTASATVADSLVDEPAPGTDGALVFTIRLLRPVSVPVTVGYSTGDNSAIDGRDYTNTGGSVKFTPGQTAKSVEVPVLANPQISGNRDMRFFLTALQNVTIQRSSAIGSIIDTSPPVYLAVSDTGVVTGYNQTSTATFTVTLSAPSTNIVQVRYNTFDQNAHAGTNYTATTGTLTFAPGVTSQAVAIPVLGQVQPENRWYFGLSLSNPRNALIADGTAYATITDNDRYAYTTVDDTTVVKPATGTATATVSVRIATPVTYPTTVFYRTTDGSAIAGTDYTPAAGTLTIPAGSTSATFPVTILSTSPTGLRYINVTLSGYPWNVGLLHNAAIYLVDAGSAPQISVQDTGVVRPTTGTTSTTFTVTALPAPTSTMTVQYATGDNSAHAGTDYTATNGVLIFSAGQTSATVTVPVTGTSLPVGDLSFYLSVNTNSAGTIQRSSALSVLTTPSASQQTPVVSVLGGAATVPTSGTGNATFTVGLSPASVNTVTVNYSTSDNNAHAGVDYAATSGTLTFAPGQTTKTVSVALIPTTTVASDKSFVLNLGAPINAALSPANYAYLTLHNANTAPLVSVGDTAGYSLPDDASSVVFPFTLSRPTVNTVTLNWSTSNGSGLDGDTYTAASGTVTFAPGQTTASVSIAIPPTPGARGPRYFYLNTGTPTNAYNAQNYAVGYVYSGLPTPLLTVLGGTVVTGAAATTLPFKIVLSTPTTAPVTVNYQTNDESAHAGTQYTATSGSVTFAPGQTSKTVSVPVAADTVSVGSTRMYLQLSGPVNAATGSQYYAYGVIEHARVTPRISGGDVIVTRQTSGSRTATVTVTLQQPSTTTVTVDYNTSDGNAVSGTDYTATAGTLTFAPGDTSKTVAIPILAGPATTPERNFYLYMSNPTNATLARNPVYLDIESPNTPTSYLTVDESSVTTSPTGSVNAVSTLRISPAPTAPVVVNYATSDGSARAGVDYTAAQGSVTFPAGTSTRTVTVPVANKPQSSGDIGFTMNVGVATGPAQVQRSNAGVAILDAQPPAYLQGGPDVTVVRGTTGTATAVVTATLSPAQTVPVTVSYGTFDDSAVAGRDYDATSGQLTFAPGQTSASLSVTVHGNGAIAGLLRFGVQFDNSQGAGLGSIDDSRTYVYLDPVDSFEITGLITDDSGAPLPGVTVTRTGNNLPTLSVVTDDKGRYSIPNSTIGSYTTSVSAAGLSFTPASRKVDVVGGTTQLLQTIGYTGNGVIVRALSPTGTFIKNALFTRTGNGQPTLTRKTNNAGFAVFGATPDGSYTLTASGGGYAAYVPGTYTVTVAGASTDIVQFSGVVAPYISGQVTAAGVGVSGVTVSAGGGRTAVTSAQGYYSLSGLSNGTYTVTPSRSGSTFTPANRSVQITGGVSQTGVDFTRN